MKEEQRLMMSEEEVRERAKEILNIPREELITNHLFLQQENQQLKIQVSSREEVANKYKKVIDRIEKYIEKETRIYGLSMSIELGTHFDNILDILKEVK